MPDPVMFQSKRFEREQRLNGSEQLEPTVTSWDPTIPPGGRIVDVRFHGEVPADLQAKADMEKRVPPVERCQPAHLPIHIPEIQGRVVDSSALFLPSTHQRT